jgi:hypothetical protein
VAETEFSIDEVHDEPDSHPTIAGWIEKRSADLLDRRALEIALLLAEERAWIHRRVETVAFLDSNRIKRHMSVDFTVPELEVVEGQAVAPDLLVVALPRKRAMKDFDITDESGSSFPVLTLDENSAIAAKILEDQAEELLAEKGLALSPYVKSLLCDVAGMKHSSEDAPTEEDRQDRVIDAIDVFLSTAGPTTNIDQLEGDLRLIGVLWADQVFSGLVRELGERFLLLVKNPHPAGRRAIVKLSYEEQADQPRGTAPPGPSLKNRLLEGLGLAYLPIRIQARALFGAGSYHMEVVVPDEILVKKAELGVRSVNTDRTAAVGSPNRRTVDLEPIKRARDSARPHLFAQGQSRAAPGTRDPLRVITSETGYVDLALALKPSEVIPNMISSAFTAFILLTGAVLGSFGFTSAPEPSTALLVVIPGIFAAYFLPGEHRLVRKMYRLLRISSVVSAMAAFVAAAVLDISFGHTFTVTVWYSMGILSALMFVTLLHAARLSWRQISLDWVRRLSEPF